MHAQVADTLQVLDWLHGAQRKQMHAQRASMWVAVQKMAPDAAYLASSASSGECLSHITSVSNCLCQGTSLLLAATPRSMAAGSSIAQHLGSICRTQRTGNGVTASCAKQCLLMLACICAGADEGVLKVGALIPQDFRFCLCLHLCFFMRQCYTQSILTALPQF